MADHDDASVLLPKRARRAPRKKNLGVPKPRAPRRPRRKQALELTDLPAEILEKIISTLLPPRADPVNGFPHPREALYPPAKVLYGSNSSSIPERCGSIPSGIMDIVRVGSCSKQLRAVAGKVMSSIGGSRPPQPHNSGGSDMRGDQSRPAKRARLGLPADGVDNPGDQGDTSAESETVEATPDPSLRPITEMEAAPKKILYLQEEHCAIEAGNFRELLVAHRETLQEVVIYKCRHFARPDRLSVRFMEHMAPLQSGSEDDPPALPRLQRLQVGPKLCLRCIQAAVHIFCGIWTFRTPREEARHIKNWGSYTPEYGGTEPDSSIRNPFAYDHRFRAPAPGGVKAVRCKSPAAPNLVSLQLHYPNHQTPTDEHQRHFGIMPHTSKQTCLGLKLFTLYIASDDDTEGGFGHNGTCSLFKVKSPLEVEKEIHEAAQTPLRLKEERQTAERARKEALRLQKYKADIPKLLKAKQVPKLERAYNIEFDDQGTMIIRNKDNSEMSAALTLSASRSASASWHKVNSQHRKDRPASLSQQDSFSDFSSISDSDGETVGDAKEVGRPDDGTDRQAADASETSLHTQYGQKKRKVMIRRLAQAVQLASQLFPNLTGLQVFRSGPTRCFLAEDSDVEQVVSAAFAIMTRSFKSLRWFDLGLAVVGRREMTDFPLGFTLNTAPPGPLTKEATEYHDRREKAWRDRVDKATTEGDAWRQTVLDRLVLGISKQLKPEDSRTPQEAARLARALKLSTLPATLECGYMYTADLNDRRKRKVVVIPWHRSKVGDKETVVIGEKESITL